MNNSNFLRLNLRDIGRGLLIAVLVAIFTFLAKVFTPDFTFSSFDWSSLVKVALTAAFAYLGKNFLSTEEGKFLGKL